MANRKGVFIGAYVPNELKESLRRRAAAEHRTLSQEITRILTEAIHGRNLPAGSIDRRTPNSATSNAAMTEAAAAFCALCAPGNARALSMPGTSSRSETSTTVAGCACSQAAIARDGSSSTPITARSLLACRSKIARLARA